MGVAGLLVLSHMPTPPVDSSSSRLLDRGETFHSLHSPMIPILGGFGVAHSHVGGRSLILTRRNILGGSSCWKQTLLFLGSFFSLCVEPCQVEVVFFPLCRLRARNCLLYTCGFRVVKNVATIPSLVLGCCGCNHLLGCC